MNTRPRFITIDGPNGVGKTSVVRALVSTLESVGVEAVATREPTVSLLGQLCRQSEEHLRGRALTCLIAADRYNHIETEINNALKCGKTVICDRYVESSLVLQAFDGVETAYIWELNRFATIPHLSLELFAAPETIERRRDGRTPTRFEREHSPMEELIAYRHAADFLTVRNYNIEWIDAECSISEVVKQAMGLLRG